MAKRTFGANETILLKTSQTEKYSVPSSYFRFFWVLKMADYKLGAHRIVGQIVERAHTCLKTPAHTWHLLIMLAIGLRRLASFQAQHVVQVVGAGCVRDRVTGRSKTRDDLGRSCVTWGRREHRGTVLEFWTTWRWKQSTIDKRQWVCPSVRKSVSESMS